MNINGSDRITIRRLTFPLLLFSALVVFIVAIPEGAPFAQTSNSLRIRSIGDSFAGIIEDPHTDAYLNPACVGDLRDRQIYVARLPNTSLKFDYPDNAGVSSYWSAVLPPEMVPGDGRYEWPQSFTAYTLGFVTPLTGSTKLSLSLDAAADGYDDLSSSDQFQVYTSSHGGSDFRATSSTYGREQNLYHFVADAAVGTGDPASEGTRAGVRVRVGYDQMQFGRVRVDDRVEARYPDINELINYYDYDRDRGDYERTSAQLSFGLYRNSGVFAQAVLGGVGQRETLTSESFMRTIDDDDYDDNGLGIYGDMTPYYSTYDRTYDAVRSYDCVILFGRMGLRWGDRIRSFHRLSWGHSNGDGNGFTKQDQYISEFEIFEQLTTLSYELDGNTKRFTTDHSIGYVNPIGDDLQIAFGVQARVEYQDFEEQGSGAGLLSISDGSSSESYDSPYSQIAARTREYWVLALPVGVDWNFYRGVAWRMGAQARTTRVEDCGEIRRKIDFIEIAAPGENPSFRNIAQEITYETSLYISMGFGFAYRNKLTIDILTATTTSSFNAATVATVQVKYYF